MKALAATLDLTPIMDVNCIVTFLRLHGGKYLRIQEDYKTRQEALEAWEELSYVTAHKWKGGAVWIGEMPEVIKAELGDPEAGLDLIYEDGGNGFLGCVTDPDTAMAILMEFHLHKTRLREIEQLQNCAETVAETPEQVRNDVARTGEFVMWGME